MVAGIAITIVIILETITAIIKHMKTGRTNTTSMIIPLCIIFMITSMFTVPFMILGNNAAIRTTEIINGRDFDSNEKNSAVRFIGMGLSDESVYGPGFFLKNIADSSSVEQGEKEANEEISHRMNQLTTNPAGFISFFMRKIAYTWSEPSFSYSIRPAVTLYQTEKDKAEKTGLTEFIETPSQKIIDSKQLNAIITICLDSLVNIIVVFGCISAFRNKRNLTIMLPSIIITGGFLFHLLWETQPEYAYTYFILFIPYASDGIIRSCEYYKERQNDTISC